MCSSSSTSNDSSSYTIHKSLAELVDRYDGFILDQFGVMHNGLIALDGATTCAHQLRHKHNKRLVILSNSSSLAPATLTRLTKLGFAASDFVGAVTSGQEACQFVQTKYGHADKTIKALVLTWESTEPALAFLTECGANIVATTKVDDADFVLLHGCQQILGSRDDNAKSEPMSLQSYFESGDTSIVEPILEQCCQHNLELVCCNPDYVYVSPDGTIKHMPGTIADLYQTKYQGIIHSFGKPHKAHFDACVRALDLPRDRIAHVGDSLHHDVKGANAARVASIFVANGVHRDELGIHNDGDVPSRDALDALFAKHGYTPRHVVPMFQY